MGIADFFRPKHRHSDVRVRTVPPYELVGRSLAAAMPKGTGAMRLAAVVAKSADLRKAS